MQQIIGVTELQRKFRSFFDEVVRKRTPLILTRGCGREAVLIPYEDYLRFQQMQESEVLARFDRVWRPAGGGQRRLRAKTRSPPISRRRGRPRIRSEEISMRVVVDTGVLVSALIRRQGTTGDVLQALRDGRFSSSTSIDILVEIVDVLGT